MQLTTNYTKADSFTSKFELGYTAKQKIVQTTNTKPQSHQNAMVTAQFTCSKI